MRRENGSQTCKFQIRADISEPAATSIGECSEKHIFYHLKYLYTTMEPYKNCSLRLTP